MTNEPPGDVTAVLREIQDGLPGAPDRLMALVYAELKKIAHNRLASRSKGLSEVTTLVHEAYLRLFAGKDVAWENRHHFFFAASRAMRDILVDRARRDHAQKRGGGRPTLELNDEIPVLSRAADLLAIHEALERLERIHPENARIVMLMFFAGLTRDEVAGVTGRSPSAVWREWNFAKAWLLDALGDHVPSDS